MTARVLRAATVVPSPVCECLCTTWAHQDCTGQPDVALTVRRGGVPKWLRVCGPFADDLAGRIPVSARSAA